jgi:tRNA threonylcarbamoyl adenosine modification protein YeaZ
VLIIAFDTATPAVTVALHDGSDLLASETAVDSRHHGELLAPAIAKVLAAAGAAPADLTAVAVGTGPGPYTGLRAGLVTARVLGSTLQVRLDGICTLDVIAEQARPGAAGRPFLVATDARRREVYWASYSATGQRLTGPAVSLPADLPAGYPIAGQGCRLYEGPGTGWQVIDPVFPDAAVLARMAAARIAAGVPAEPPQPLYLRRPDAREPGRPKRVTPVSAVRK